MDPLRDLPLILTRKQIFSNANRWPAAFVDECLCLLDELNLMLVLPYLCSERHVEDRIVFGYFVQHARDLRDELLDALEGVFEPAALVELRRETLAYGRQTLLECGSHRSEACRALRLVLDDYEALIDPALELRVVAGRGGLSRLRREVTILETCARALLMVLRDFPDRITQDRVVLLGHKAQQASQRARALAYPGVDDPARTATLVPLLAASGDVSRN